MEVMFDRVAGLDVGKDSVTVCVRTPGPRGGRRSVTRTFKTMFGSLRVMRDWLVETGVRIAAMESTSTYWKPPFYCLGGGHGGVAAERRAHEGGARPEE
jgi:transposase